MYNSITIVSEEIIQDRIKTFRLEGSAKLHEIFKKQIKLGTIIYPPHISTSGDGKW
jgi:hypothetical protein